MFYRYVAEKDNETQGLITLIPFLENINKGQNFDVDDWRALNRADMFIEEHLPYPVKDGADVYRANRGKTLVAYFTEYGNKIFAPYMYSLESLLNKYGSVFGYSAKEVSVDGFEGEVVYNDDYQVIVSV